MLELNVYFMLCVCAKRSKLAMNVKFLIELKHLSGWAISFVFGYFICYSLFASNKNVRPYLKIPNIDGNCALLVWEWAMLELLIREWQIIYVSSPFTSHFHFVTSKRVAFISLKYVNSQCSACMSVMIVFAFVSQSTWWVPWLLSKPILKWIVPRFNNQGSYASYCSCSRKSIGTYQ